MSDALRTPIGALMTYSQWRCNPIFIFKTRQTPNDTSNIFSIKVDLTTTLVTPTDIFVLGLYDSYLTLEYDEQARLVSMNPSPQEPLLA